MESFHDATRRMAIGLASVAFASIPMAHAAGNAAGSPTQSTRALTALIGDAACDDDSQCRTMPVGAKPCGGPEYYLAWSTRHTSAEALRQAAGDAIAAPRIDRGMSTCVFVTDPGAYCAPATGEQRGTANMPRGSCRLRAPGRGAPGRAD